MASINDAFGARLQLDIDDFLSGATTAKQALAELRREFRNEVAGLDNWRNSIDGVTARIDMLNASIKIEQQFQANLEKQIADLSKNEKEHAESLKKKQKELENSRAEVDRYNREIRNLDKTLGTLRAEEAKNNTALSKLSRTINEQENELAELIFSYHNAILTFGKSSDEARDFERRIKSLNDELRENRNVMNEVTGVDPTKGFSFGTLFSGTMLGNVAGNLLYDALSLVKRGFSEMIDTSIEFESRFMDVRKTVDGTADDFNHLYQELQGMGNEVTTSLPDIAEIASIAGQMGLAVDEVGEFTRVMIMLGDTTNISAEEAGDSLAKLSNLLNLSTSDFERMGSAIVQLGNEFPTTEADIATMASRLSGMAGQVSMSAADILGLANALSAVGLEAEMGGNTISKTMREMLLSIENGSDTLALFASTANMTVEEFSNLFRRDATQALIRFVEGLDDVGRNGKSATQILQNLNITETRQIDTLLRLTGNSELLAESINSANEAWEENTALAAEAAKRYSTTESQIQFMKNAWQQASVVLGEVFSPIIRGGANFLEDIALSISGQDKASRNLTSSMNNLKAAIGEYEIAAEGAEGATDNLTNAMVTLQGQMVRNAMSEMARDLGESEKTLEGYQTTLEKQGKKLTDYFRLLRNNPAFTDTMVSAGFDIDLTTVDGVLGAYAQLEDIKERATIADREGTNAEKLYFNQLYNLLKDAETDIQDYNTLLTETSTRTNNLNRDIASFLGQYADLYDAGKVNVTDYADVIGDASEEILEMVQEQLDAGDEWLEWFLDLGTEADHTVESFNNMYDSMAAQLEVLDPLSKDYWEIEGRLRALVEYCREAGIEIDALSDKMSTAFNPPKEASGQSVYDLIDSYLQDDEIQKTVNAILGIEVDEKTAQKDKNKGIESILYDIQERKKEVEATLETNRNEYKSILAEDIEAMTEDEVKAWEDGKKSYEDAIAKGEKELETIGSVENWLASGYKPEDTDTRNWYEKLLGVGTNELASEIGAGLQSLASDLSSLWSTLGQGIIDTMNTVWENQLAVIDSQITELEEGLEEQLGLYDTMAEAREAQIQRMYNEGKISEEDYYRETAAASSKAEAQKQEAQEETEAKIDELNQKRNEIEQKQFEAEKANSIAQVLISAAQGIAAAWSRGEPISASIISGLIAAVSAAQIAAINQQQYVPAMATGGVVTKPTTALIGEAGAEAVVPLENNLGWINELADRISGVMLLNERVHQVKQVSIPAREQAEGSHTQNFTQIINSPKALTRKEIYRQTRQLFRIAGRT